MDSGPPESHGRLMGFDAGFENLSAGDTAVLFLDRDLRLRDFTPAILALYDIDKGDAGRSILELRSRLDHPHFRADARWVGETLQPIEHEVRVRDTEKTVLMRMTPSLTGDRIDGYVLSFSDITQPESNESTPSRNGEELARQFIELETLYDTMPVGLCLIDPEFRYVRVNAYLAEMNGLTVEENVGKTIDEVLPDMADVIKRGHVRVFQTGEPVAGVEIEGEVPIQPGVRRSWIMDYYPIRDGDALYAVAACVRDVTDERRLIRRLEESEGRIRRVFDITPLHIATTEGPDHVVTYLNPAAARPIGGTWLIGKSFPKAMPEYAAQGFFADWDHVYRTGESMRMPEIYAQTTHPETGEVYSAWHSQWLEPLRDADGNVTGVATFSHDITDVVEAREAARASEREKTLLLAELQHRVKNTLATIRAISRLLLPGSPDVTTYQKRLGDRLTAMSRTHDLLFGEYIASVSIRSLIAAELAPYRTKDDPRVHLTGSDFELSAEEATSIGMALHELTTNAAKYGALSVPEGKIDIHCDHDPSTDTRGMSWREVNGPRVEDPGERKGFGSIVIRKVLASSLGAEVDMQFHARGLQVTVAWTGRESGA